MSTKIPWAKETINPWVGCTKVREGCKNCYAERLAYRLAAMGQENYATVLDGHKWNGKVVLQMEQLEKLKHWHKGRRVFIGSMTDIFHKNVPFEEISKVFEAMYENSQHTYIIATKRPERALTLAQLWQGASSTHRIQKWPGNIHLLISCSTQKDLDEMAPVLFQIPAAVRGVSFEPLLENIYIPQGLYNHGFGYTHRQESGRINWAVIGCEKLAGNRPGRFCEDEKSWWDAARDIRRHCMCATPEIAFYMKQGPVNGKVVSDPKYFPEDLKVRQYPK